MEAAFGGVGIELVERALERAPQEAVLLTFVDDVCRRARAVG